MNQLDAFLVGVHEAEIVQLLQQQMTGVEQDIAARVIVDSFQEHLEGDTVVQVFTRMNLEADIHSSLVEGIQDWMPAPGEFVEGGLYETGGSLWPGVEIGPGQGAGKTGVGGEAEIFGGFCRQQ